MVVIIDDFLSTGKGSLGSRGDLDRLAAGRQVHSSQMITWNVQPGTYAMFCPVPRPTAGRLNAADGMVRIVRLR